MTQQIDVATPHFFKQRQNIKKEQNQILNMSIHHAKNLNVHVGYTKINIYWYYSRMKINEKYLYMSNRKIS